MKTITTFADIINLWPTAADLARDIGENDVTVRAWRNRNSIPSDKWGGVIGAAKRRGFCGVSADVFVGLAQGGGQ